MAIEVPLGERTKGSIAVDLFPLFLDEAKSVYITENPNASVAYHYHPYGEGRSPYIFPGL